MLIKVDWEQLARQIGAIEENTALDPYSARGGSNIARQALVAILGDEFWRSAVDSYVNGERGSEVISSILQLLQPKPAMERCYQIYKSESDSITRRYAVILLVDAADYSVLHWVSEFLNDPDDNFAIAGTWILDRLLFTRSEDPPSEYMLLLERAETHVSQRVREQLNEFNLRERLRARDL